MPATLERERTPSPPGPEEHHLDTVAPPDQHPNAATREPGRRHWMVALALLLSALAVAVDTPDRDDAPVPENVETIELEFLDQVVKPIPGSPGEDSSSPAGSVTDTPIAGKEEPTCTDSAWLSPPCLGDRP